MNLKEAFRYQNKLDQYFEAIIDFLKYNPNIVSTTKYHLRTKSNPEAIDETIIEINDDSLNYPIDLLVDFVVDIINEKEGVSNAIDNTKKSCSIYIDGAVSLNKKRQQLSYVLSKISAIKPQEVIKTGRDYKFNAEGNQVPYNYEIKETSVITFNQKRCKNISRELIKESDNISSEIDNIMINQDVNFTTRYDVNDSLEDALEKFVEFQSEQS